MARSFTRPRCSKYESKCHLLLKLVAPTSPLDLLWLLMWKQLLSFNIVSGHSMSILHLVTFNLFSFRSLNCRLPVVLGNTLELVIFIFRQAPQSSSSRPPWCSRRWSCWSWRGPAPWSGACCCWKHLGNVSRRMLHNPQVNDEDDVYDQFD